MEKTFYKTLFISGLQEIVKKEIMNYPDVILDHIEEDFAYINKVSPIQSLINLKSITNIFIVTTAKNYNPTYLSRHKSILGNLIEKVLSQKKFKFKTFELSCAGKKSIEVQEIIKYITETYKLKIEETNADLKVFIGKNNNDWEISICLTPRPLTQRFYKVTNIEGSLNPTIAYAMNSLLDFKNIHNYLNIFSGNATLLIESALLNPNISYHGFDIDGKRISESIKNIKQAGFIKKITIAKADIFDNPKLEKFDAIIADLPFGMKISKNQQLEKLYNRTLEYIQGHLNKNGTAILYTTEYLLIEKLMQEKKMYIEKEILLKIITSKNSFIYPKIIVYRNK